MARSHVARQLVKLGGDPVYREGVLTDNGNIIIDVHNMSITNPVELEANINDIVGVVTNGLFAARPADLLLLGTENGVKTLDALSEPAHAHCAWACAVLRPQGLRNT